MEKKTSVYTVQVKKKDFSVHCVQVLYIVSMQKIMRLNYLNDACTRYNITMQKLVRLNSSMMLGKKEKKNTRMKSQKHKMPRER